MMTATRRFVLGAAVAFGLPGCATPGAPPAEPGYAVSADGVRIAYRVVGRGDTAVVLVHGWACDSSYWREQVAALAARYAVVTLDLAGHGQSGANRSDWSIARFGDDIAAVVRSLQNRQIVLVGHSMGGPAIVAASVPLRQGSPRLIGLIGVDTLKNIGAGAPPAPVREAMTKAFSDDFAGTMRKNVAERLFRPTADPAIVKAVADDMARMPPAIAVPMLGGLFRPDYEAAMPGLHVPLVVINADFGGVTDDARSRTVAPTFRSVIVPGADHFMMLDEPKRFNEILLQQIDAIVAGTS